MGFGDSNNYEAGLGYRIKERILDQYSTLKNCAESLQPLFERQDLAHSVGTISDYLKFVTNHGIWGTSSGEGIRRNKKRHLKRLAVILSQLGIDEEDPMWPDIERALEGSAPEKVYNPGDLNEIYNQILEESSL